jgi:hypothetical protein
MSAGTSTAVWRIPPELEQPLPRRVRLSGTGVFNCVFAAASIVAGVAIAGHAVRDELRREAENQSLARSIAAEGQETEAKVTRLSTGLGIHGVGYDFTVDGRNYSGSAVMAPSHWQSLEVGSPLAILYLPSDPAKSYPESDSPNSQTHWLLVLPVAGMALFFMFSFAAIQLAAVLPERRLLARGHSASGTVTRCNPGNKGRRSGYFLHYDFPLPEGSQGQGRKFSGQPIAEGSAVAVLYDPDRPRRSTLYPMESVRLAAV